MLRPCLRLKLSWWSAELAQSAPTQSHPVQDTSAPAARASLDRATVLVSALSTPWRMLLLLARPARQWQMRAPMLCIRAPALPIAKLAFLAETIRATGATACRRAWTALPTHARRSHAHLFLLPICLAMGTLHLKIQAPQSQLKTLAQSLVTLRTDGCLRAAGLTPPGSQKTANRELYVKLLAHRSLSQAA